MPSRHTSGHRTKLLSLIKQSEPSFTLKSHPVHNTRTTACSEPDACFMMNVPQPLPVELCLDTTPRPAASSPVDPQQQNNMRLACPSAPIHNSIPENANTIKRKNIAPLWFMRDIQFRNSCLMRDRMDSNPKSLRCHRWITIPSKAGSTQSGSDFLSDW